MRIALLSDIHGNSLALDAVLADAQSIGVEAYWILGDLVALGHDPVGVLERLIKLPRLQVIRGNTDRYVMTGDRPPPYVHEVGSDLQALSTFEEVAGTFAWTQGAVTATGWLDWLKALPLELRRQLPDGTQFLGVHASPGKDDGSGISPKASDTDLRKMLNGCAADLICMGHTHLALDRRIDDWHIVNLGSVSNPRYPDLRACYIVLTCDVTGYSIEHRRVDYDRQRVIDLINAQRHPGAKFIIKHMRGEIK